MATPHRVAVIGGDGIGPEVVDAAMRCLHAAAPGRFDATTLPHSADHTLATGQTITHAELRELRASFDAALLGAVGDPRVPDNRHARDLLLGARQHLELFVNLRPIALVDARLCPLRDRAEADVDLVIVRENTEGLYLGLGGVTDRDTPDERATDLLVATRRGTERVIRFAFEHAAAAGRDRVCCVTKSNAIVHAHGLWRRVFDAVGGDYPDISTTHLYADVAAMELVRDPSRFGVIVAPNFIGDILGDLAAQLIGGLGLAPSGNIHPGSRQDDPLRFGLFEPIHGSAPDLAGTGRANPIAAIRSAAMMAAFLGERDASSRLDRAVAVSLRARDTTPDLGGSLTTSQVAEAVVTRLASLQ